MPPSTRAQKVFNVALALNALKAQSSAREFMGITPEHIVDSNRPRTLALLWSIIQTFKLPALLDVGAIKQEIAALKASHRRARRQSEEMVRTPWYRARATPGPGPAADQRDCEDWARGVRRLAWQRRLTRPTGCRRSDSRWTRSCGRTSTSARSC